MNSRTEEARQRKACGKYNCAQAVACTYSDLTPLTEEQIAAVTSGFGTGFGTMKGTCGALVGAGVILGLKINDRVKSRAAMKRVMERFEARNGATVCGQLKGIATGCPLRPCNDCVADAAEFLEAELAALAPEPE